MTTSRQGSSIIGASLNFSNSILGAGCIGYGGAIANSGGGIAVLAVFFFAFLSKISFDAVVALALEKGLSSYEDLGAVAYGRKGRYVVVAAKGLFAFGCLVAYIVIVKQNFASACRNILLGNDNSVAEEGFSQVIFNDSWAAAALSACVMLPLSMLRNMALLEKFSAVKIATFGLIILILMYLCFFGSLDEGTVESTSFASHWLVIREGVFESMGTFVFTFVAQHTAHLVFDSLRRDVRNLDGWKKVSTLSIIISSVISLLMGLFAYMTFWEQTQSDLFALYPPSASIETARIFLCITMLLTYPVAFFSFRDLIVGALSGSKESKREPEDESLLPQSTNAPTSQWLLPGYERQLRTPYHVLLTVVLWATSLILALAAPSLGDVLNLVGCVSGTGIAFILPGMFSYRLRGYSHVSALLFVVGGFVGCVGTFFSLVQLISGSSR